MVNFTMEELLIAQANGEALSDIQLSETLIELAAREKVLLDGPMGKDPELRAVVVFHFTVLSAAAARLQTLHDELPTSEEEAAVLLEAMQTEEAEQEKIRKGIEEAYIKEREISAK